MWYKGCKSCLGMLGPKTHFKNYCSSACYQKHKRDQQWADMLARSKGYVDIAKRGSIKPKNRDKGQREL